MTPKIEAPAISPIITIKIIQLISPKLSKIHITLLLNLNLQKIYLANTIILFQIIIKLVQKHLLILINKITPILLTILN
jgi:hypothetical protein